MLPGKHTCKYYLTQVVPTCSISRTSGVSGCASRASIYASRAALTLARIAARISLNFFCLPVCILFFTVCTLRDWYSLSASRIRTSSLCSRRVPRSISSDESASDIDVSVPAAGLVAEGRTGFLKAWFALYFWRAFRFARLLVLQDRFVRRLQDRFVRRPPAKCAFRNIPDTIT